DAVIFNQVTPDDPRVAYLMEKGFPFVTHGRTQWSDQHPYCDFDNGAFARIAVRAFVDRGRKAIMLIAPPHDQNYAQNMIRGAREMAAELGVSMTILPGATSDDTSDKIETALQEYLATGMAIDGVICPSSNSSLAAVSGVEDAGLVIGETVDICAKEVTPILKRIRKTIMTVTEDVAASGAFMARAAIQRIKEPTSNPMHRLDVPTDVS
ncbi:substrate-binding domain-containing protein, partial [uncultured Kiloniella sp.]|uniref:substrate-binding domain-containing protein n=1 Tax=uncultured Kiloniella sp. TaxID=1133091 RepID=UPI002609755A